MKSVKAIFIGSSFVIVSILLIQLLYLFVVVGYNYLVREYDFGVLFSESVGTVIWVITYLLVMFYGGYVTAEYSEKKAVLHSLVVGGLVTAVMVAMALQNTQLTFTGILIAIASVVIAAAGGVYSQRSETPGSH